MKRINILALIGFGMLSIFLVGCDNATSPADETTDDIVALIQAEDSLFAVDAFGDMQGDSLILNDRHHGHRGFSGPFFPRFIRRVIDNANRSIDVEVITDDSALVTITHQIAGTMFIGMNTDTTNDTRIDTVWEKPFDITSTHKVITVRRDFTDSRMPRMGMRHRGWRIAGITPIVSSAANSDLTVNSMIIRNVTADTVVQISEPLNYFFNWHNATLFLSGDSVEVSLVISNDDNSGTTVLAQFMGRFFPRKRVVRIFDDGILPDMTAEDGTFTGGWHFGDRPGMRHFMLDIVDNDLLTVQDVPYNAVFWQFPVMVMPDDFGPRAGGPHGPGGPGGM